MNTVLITGANRGIGLELARQLSARGDQVIAACRNSSAELDATGARIVAGVDVGSEAAAARLAGNLDGIKLDWLINNAGVLSNQSLESLDYAAMEQQFRVNSLGPLFVTAALRNNLGAGSKVGIVTSRMGSIEDNTSGGSYGYRMSKAAANMAGMSLAHDLRDRSIAVALLHPGYVMTDMTGGKGLITVEQSARGLIQRMEELDMDSSGAFWHVEGEQLPW